MAKKDVDIFLRQGNVCVSVGKEIVFERPKTEQSVSIANAIYMYHKYKDEAKERGIV